MFKIINLPTGSTMKKFHNAFTLAEILITLGIIGVIAAMTIPTLSNSISLSKVKPKLKKSISTVYGAVNMTMANYDINFSSSSTDAECEITDTPTTNNSFCAIFNGSLQGHTITKTKPIISQHGTKIVYYSPENVTGAPTEAPRYLTLSNGTLIVFSGKAKNCTKDISTGTINGSNCTGYIDINGISPPNKEVSCLSTTATQREYVAPNCQSILPPSNPGVNPAAAFNMFIPAAYAVECDDIQGGGYCRCPDGYEPETNPVTCRLSCYRTVTVAVPVDPCVVPKDPEHLSDIVPVVFHDGVIEPATDAGKYVLNKL